MTTAASFLTDNERKYLAEQQLGRLATSGKTGMPHVIPTGFHLDADRDTIKIGGHNYRGQDRLYIRHLRGNPQAAFVVDDLVTVPGWQPRGITLKGEVRIHETGGEVLGRGFGPRWIELIPTWVSSWGIDGDPFTFTEPRRRAVDGL